MTRVRCGTHKPRLKCHYFCRIRLV